VFGNDLLARKGDWPLVLAVLDSEPLQPQDRELGGARRRLRRPCRLPGATFCLSRRVAALNDKPVLHGDTGSTLKATTVLAMLNWLGVKPSYSRPWVSDDNAYAESLCRTAKYRPEFPSKGFDALKTARQWGAAFVHWYNWEHKHSGICYVSPQQRHTGEEHAILAARHVLYTEAKQRNPARWARHTRDWRPIGPVTLNPDVIPLSHSTKRKSEFTL
jgi:hypothetical protein